MRFFRPGSSLLVLFAALFLSMAAFAQSPTSRTAQSANNTSACDTAGAATQCLAGFTGMSDSSGNVYNAAPKNTSTVDVHELVYANNNTRVFTHLMPWFCMDPTQSSSTGVSYQCGKHMQIGYNSNDASVVHAQMEDMLQRGFNGTIIDWYGTQVHPSYDGMTQLVSNDLSQRCKGDQDCPMYFSLVYDQGSFQWTSCPQDGGGTDQTNCIIKAMNADFDYMNSQYFSNSAYLRVNSSDMSISRSGKPVVMFFVCETCFTNPSPNWTSIWGQLRNHVDGYGNNSPALIFRNSGAFSHVNSDGGFAWPNWYGTSDTYGLVYLDNFYDVAHKTLATTPSDMTFGSGWKGFNATSASWGGTNTIDQQCGNTWVKTFQEMGHNSDFSSSAQLPFLQVATWNDYEEGTEIESGIDNCLSLNASLSGTRLSWTPKFSSSAGSEATVHHYVVYDSTDGETLTKLATFAPNTHSVDLSTYSLGDGSHTLYVQAVGQPSITNKMSPAVTFSSGALQSITLASSTLYEGQSTMATVTLAKAAPSGDATVSLSSSDPAVQVASSVTIPAGSNSATVPVITTNVSGPVSATISGTYQTVTQTATLAVNPIAVSLSVAPSSVLGGNAAQGTLTLSSAAPDNGIVVNVASSSNVAQVPATVSVPAGASSATFAIATSAVNSASSTTISASYDGVTQNATLKVTSMGIALALSPGTLTGGTSSAGTVTLATPAPSGGTSVTLSSNNSAATVPASITIAAGATQGSFTVSTTAVSSATSAVITASASGSTQSATLNIQAPVISSASLSPTSLGGSLTSKLTVTLNGAAPSGGAAVKLSSSSSSATLPSSVTIAAGNKSATVTVSTSVVSITTAATLTATYGSSSKSAVLTVNVTPASVALSPSSMKGGSSSAGTVTLSGAAPSGGTTVSLTSSSSSASVPSSVVVAAGAKTATFTIKSSAVSGTKSVVITVKAWSVKKTATLTLTH